MPIGSGWAGLVRMMCVNSGSARTEKQGFCGNGIV